MKKFLLSFLAAAAVAAPGIAKESGATYQFISTPEEFVEDAEYIIAYSNPGGIYNAQCDIFSINPCPSQRGYFAIANGGTLADNVISDVEGEPALFRVEKMGDNFAVYMKNGEKPGYLTPLAGKNGLTTSDTPQEMKISMGMGKSDDSGQKPSYTTFITFAGSDFADRSCFSWVNTPISMQMTHIFWVCAQEEYMGTLGFYKKIPANPALDWTADPEDFSSVEKVQDFTITFPKAKAITMNTLKEGDIVATFNGDACVIPSVTCEGNSIKGNFSTPFEEDGTINITFLAGLFEITCEDDSKIESPMISYDLTIEEPAPAISKIVATPEPGSISNLNKIRNITLNVEMTRPTEIAINQNIILSIEHYPYVDDVPAAESTRIGFFNPTVTETGAINYVAEFIVDEESIANGIIALSLPAEYFSWKFKNQTIKSTEPYEFKYDYKYSNSVNGIFTDNDSFTVYTATGICLLRNADKEAVEQLPEGLYIINGKKFIKK